MRLECCFYNPHEKINPENDTREKHEAGQVRQEAVEKDKKRQHPDWSQKQKKGGTVQTAQA